MPLRRVCGAAVALVALGLGAADAGGERAATSTACASNDTAAMAGCLQRAVDGAEATLDDAMKTARAAIGGGALTGAALKKALELFETSAAQWRAARDANCQAYELYDSALGAGGAPARLSCLLNDTVQRESMIKRMYSSE